MICPDVCTFGQGPHRAPAGSSQLSVMTPLSYLQGQIAYAPNAPFTAFDRGSERGAKLLRTAAAKRVYSVAAAS